VSRHASAPVLSVLDNVDMVIGVEELKNKVEAKGTSKMCQVMFYINHVDDISCDMVTQPSHQVHHLVSTLPRESVVDQPVRHAGEDKET